MFRLLISSFFIFIFNIIISAQTSESLVKTSLIFRFSQLIEWENESSIDTFRFGLLTHDSILISEFNTIYKTKKLRSKQITFFVDKEIDSYDNMHCIFIDYDFRKYLNDVAKQTYKKGVLIITYNSPDLLLTMLNIYKQKKDKTLKFEVNKLNLDKNGFVYKPDLLLYGASLVDIRELYLSVNHQLNAKALELDSINNDLIDLKIEESRYQYQIEQMSDRILTIQDKVNDKENEVAILNNDINKMDYSLNLLNSELLNRKQQQRMLSMQLKSQNDSVKKGEANLRQLNNELRTKRSQIVDSKTIINSQSIKIETQKKGLFLAAFLGFALIIIVVLIVLALRTKRKLAKRLKYLVKKRTKDLQKSKQYYLNLFENTPVAVCEFDLSSLLKYLKTTKLERLSDKLVLEATKYIKINDTNFQTLELYNAISKQEFIDKYQQLFNKESIPGLKDLFAKLLNNEIQFESEITRVSLKKDIIYLIQKVTALPSGKSKYSKVLVSMLDITKQKMYEQEILRHRNHLEDLVKERTKEVVKLNENLFQANEELQSKNEDLSGKNSQLNKQQKEIFDLNSGLVEANTQLEEQKEELINTLDKLNTTQKQLVESEKMASLGMLTAGVAHEINNPINFISSGNQALEMIFEELWDKFKSLKNHNGNKLIKEIELLSKNIEDDDYHAMINDIIVNMHMGVSRITEIVNSLQIYSRKSDIDLSPYNIHDGIESALVILRNKYKYKVEIIKSFGNIPLIITSPGKINQILINIFSNAFDAINDNGVVEIVTINNEKDKVVEIVIKDNGTGISEENLSKIFDPFYTTKEAGEGTGLGMYITYGIINQLKGTIKLESAVGKGTSVLINLPVKS